MFHFCFAAVRVARTWKQRIPLANRKAYRRSSNAEEKYLDIHLELAERVAVFMLRTFKPSRVEKIFHE